jgi:hypothetical protein
MCFSIIFLVPTFSSSYHEIFSMNQVFFNRWTPEGTIKHELWGK